MPIGKGRFGDATRGSRQARGYGTAWDKLRREVLRRDAGICQPCKRDGLLHEGNEVDHITPKSQGGTDEVTNLECICATRHRQKTAREAMAGGADR